MLNYGRQVALCYQNSDVDECAHQPAPCSQQCNNTDGSFICSCSDGYYLSDDMVTCYGESNVNCCYRQFTLHNISVRYK